MAGVTALNSLNRLALVPAAIILTVALAHSVAAAQLPDPKIAVLDYQRVLRESQAGKDIRQQIDRYRKSYQDEIKVKEAKLRKKEDELKRQRAVLASDIFAKRRREFEEEVISLQRQVQDRTRALDQAYEKAMQQLRKPLLPLVKDLAKQMGYNVVLDHARVLVVLKGMDITDIVVKKLNKKVPTIKVAKPAAK